MRKIKKDISNFDTLSNTQMKQITGGKYIEVIIDGVKKVIWIPD